MLAMTRVNWSRKKTWHLIGFLGMAWNQLVVQLCRNPLVSLLHQSAFSSLASHKHHLRHPLQVSWSLAHKVQWPRIVRVCTSVVVAVVVAATVVVVVSVVAALMSYVVMAVHRSG